MWFDSLSFFQVAKARYGEPPSLLEQQQQPPTVELHREQLLTEQLQLQLLEQREQLVVENRALKEQLKRSLDSRDDGSSASSLIFEKFKSAIKFLEDIDLQSGFLTNTKKMVGFSATERSCCDVTKFVRPFFFVTGGPADTLAFKAT